VLRQRPRLIALYGRCSEMNARLLWHLGLICFSMHSIKMIFPREMVAHDGGCKTFDSAADNFGSSEACGVLVLKRYTDANKD